MVAKATRPFSRSGGIRRPGADAQTATSLLPDSPHSAKDRRAAWLRKYHRGLVVTDLVIVVLAVMGAQFLRFGVPDTDTAADLSWTYINFIWSATLIIGWMVVLAVWQSRSTDAIGTGIEEYRRIVTATCWLFGAVAVGCLVSQAPSVRGYFAIAFPAGLFGLLLGRRIWRAHLVRQHRSGRLLNRVIVIGSRPAVCEVTDSFGRAEREGYTVIGALVPGLPAGANEDIETPAGPIPVLGDENSVKAAVTLTDADTVLVAADRLGHDRMRMLAWSLESLGVELLVSPGVADVALPRLRIRAVDTLPLLSLSKPRADGVALTGKRALDLAVALGALLTTLPVIVMAAIAIKVEDRGPVFFRQKRVGLHGEVFRIWKLRTMYVDAESRVSDARARAGQNDSVFYKSADDARITRVGRFLRRTSIDELPQLFNVISGEMSVVGPRPLVEGEGAGVANFVERRGLVKPGITGLWQVSGRSDASEQERIRLDHYYVDNWSPVQDAVIVWRTVRAVLKSEGAY